MSHLVKLSNERMIVCQLNIIIVVERIYFVAQRIIYNTDK